MDPTRCRPRSPPATHARAGRRRPTGRGLRALRPLREVMPSPVVDLNRAVAHSMAFGPEAGLKLVDEIAQAAALRNYAPLPAARGDFLFRAGRLAEAKVQFERAAGLTRNARRRRSFSSGRRPAAADPGSRTPCMGLSERCTFTGSPADLIHRSRPVLTTPRAAVVIIDRDVSVAWQLCAQRKRRPLLRDQAYRCAAAASRRPRIR